MQRVYDYLAALRLERKVHTNGIVSLGGITYSVGRKHAGKRVHVRFDPKVQEWLFLENSANGQQEIARRPLKELDVTSLTGLERPSPPSPIPPSNCPCLALRKGYGMMRL
jgi:hypothetical protein